MSDWEYYYRPTLANAIGLLDSLGMHVPFANSGSASSSTRHSTTALKGGDARIQALPYLDLLHDLRGRAILTNQTLTKILDASGLTAADRAEFQKAYRSQDTDFTRFVARRMGISGEAEVVSDGHLYERMLSWRERPRIEIVLDGVVDEITLPLPPIGEWDFSRSMALYATVMAMFGNFPGQTPAALQEVVFLHGTFQTMDIAGWSGFIKRWIHSMKAALPRIRAEAVPDESIQPFEPHYKVYADHIEIAAASIPIRTVRLDLQNPDGPEGILKSAAAAIGTTFPKETLGNILYAYTLASPKEKQAFEPILWLYAHINWLRDSYKADVAIRRDAVYITFDRIAFTYYMLRSGLERAPHQGILFA